MALIDDALASLRDLSFWVKAKRNQTLTLADVSSIIPLRWPFFRDNWESIKQGLIEQIPQYSDPDGLKVHIDKLSKLIEVQRSSNNQSVNPFSKASALNKYLHVFENVFVTSLPLTKEEVVIFDREKNRVNDFIKTDFRVLRESIILARDELSDRVGGTDDDYNATYNRSPLSKLKDITPKDVQLMMHLQVGVQTVDYVLANAKEILSTVNIDPFALARANANNEDIIIDSGKGANLVKMNFGDDLKSLAHRFLGDPDRWIEIAIANGLRAPYVDEIGQSVLLLSNANGNQINLGSEDTGGNSNLEKFYIGQPIFLTSDTEKFPEQRSIVNIKEVPVSGELVIELSGDPDLTKYRLDEAANVRVYLPNTINSLFLVQIPTTEAANTQLGEEPFFLSDKSEDEKRAGVDLGINDDFDLIFTPTSDFQLSYGIPNAIQAIKIKMVSEKGQNPRHENFGLTPVQGMKFTDPVQIRNEITTSINDMIESDLRFERVENLSVRSAGTLVQVILEVRMAGSGSVIPISFSVNTS